MRTLFPHEEELFKKSNFTLTNIRVWSSGRNQNKSIMLVHITSIENKNTSYEFLLVIAALLIGGWYLTMSKINQHFMGNSELLILFMIPVLISVFLYFFTQKNTLKIKSPSTEIVLPVSFTPKKELLSLMDEIEMAMDQRLMELKQ